MRKQQHIKGTRGETKYKRQHLDLNHGVWERFQLSKNFLMFMNLDLSNPLDRL